MNITSGGQTRSVTINDTSLTPSTYSITPNIQTVNENGEVVFSVTTTNVANNTTLYWTTKQISGTINGSDFSDNVLIGTVIINNNTGSISRTVSDDFTTEGQEQFAIDLRTGSSTGTIVATSSTVTINDTSLTPPPPYPGPYSLFLNIDTNLT